MTFHSETWRNVPSLPQVMVSSEGRVMVMPYQASMPKGGIRSYGGEPHFGVWNKTDARFTFNYKGRTYKLAPLICEAFNGPKPFKKAVCMHLDENSANNRPENLEWGTQKQNLNASRFLEYCRSRIGRDSPRVRGMT